MDYSFKRNIATCDNGLFIMEGTVFLSGSTTGSNQNVQVTHNLTGTMPDLASGSSPNIRTSSFGVTRVATGSYDITLLANVPSLKCATFTLGTYAPLFDLKVQENTQRTTMSGTVNSSGVQTGGTVSFYLLSASSGVSSLYDPTGSVQVHCHLAFKNSSV